jgi:peptidoglycan/LPS O-acetylase OafA/YrhL
MELNDLKKVWLSADTGSLPGAADMVRMIRKYRSSNLAKKIAMTIIAAVLTALMVFVVFSYKSVMLTTRIGEALIIMAGLLLIISNARSLGRLHRVKDHTNKEFLSYLMQVQRNRLKYYKTTQVAGLLLASSGLLLYIYEAVSANLLLLCVAYVALAAWLYVNWFVIRPRAYRRQAMKLQATIDKASSISKQL